MKKTELVRIAQDVGYNMAMFIKQSAKQQHKSIFDLATAIDAVYMEEFWKEIASK